MVELSLAPEITLRYDQPVEDLDYPQQKFTENISTPQDGDSFTLASITNGSKQVKLIILRGPYFVSCM